MAEATTIWVQWLNYFGTLVGLPAAEEQSDLGKYYRQLCFALHPDSQPSTMDPREVARREHFFKVLSGAEDTYIRTPEALEPPDTSAFEPDDQGDHEGDTAPPKTRSTSRGRRVYLVTFSHSHAAGRRSPSEFSRREIGTLLVAAFEAAIPDLKVLYAAVFQELHASSSTDSARSIHFHVSVKSDRQHQWAPIAEYLRRVHSVFVHFAVSGEGYWSAFRYGWWPTRHKPFAELDKEFEIIDGKESHPSPEEASRCPTWTKRKHKRPSPDEERGFSYADQEDERESDEQAGDEPKCRRESVWAYAFRLIRDHNLRTGDSFLSFVQRLGDTRLITLCLQRSAASIVEKVLHIQEADLRLKRQEMSRSDILREAAASPCTCDQPGKWKMMALELLRFQSIPPHLFASTVMAALEAGASKGVNVFIYGSTTSAKSWIIDPLRVIYRCHLTPPLKSGFPLQDLPSKEVILWNDFRLVEDVLSWSNLLLIFEGTDITIRRPRNEFQGDLDFKVIQPVFITSLEALRHYNPEEKEMMDRRFAFLHFAKTLPATKVRKAPPCASCFASLCLPNSAPANAHELCLNWNGPNIPQSQSSSSSDSDLPRSASSSSTELQFCGSCGLSNSSSPYCRATGSKHP